MPRSALLNVMVQAATKVGRSLARDFGEVENLQVSVKGPGDFVSSADHRADEIAIEALKRARPGYGFLTEESGELPGSDKTHRWIIDPLDGTTNFLHGVPLFAVSIALERDGELVAGVVYNPVLDELYTAERGTGAFLNGRRLRVSARRDPVAMMLSTGSPTRQDGAIRRFADEATGIAETSASLRVTGSAALDLAWVAAGRLDGYWQYGLSPWDVAAGMVLVGEAGGIVTDAVGRKDIVRRGDIAAGSTAAHRQILTTLKAADALA